ncbi:hypothetical protein GCM10010435_95850 [Winogradskya consettensis]|uniref:DUF4034 domain-containing protein n=1 Tax=Winogradskya consettensis TaxID=113560 RepID=A0A919VWU3_9ACTN|nr:hypothetical protein [Actinoplanes consettensis]GIM79901.1 hypothetical protein Aco04nite_67900 [Actinoplanes consettensis]
MQPADVSFAAAAAFPEVAAAVQALQIWDWPSVRAELDAAPPGMRAFVVHELAEHPEARQLAGYAWQQQPSDTAAAAVLAAHLIHTGWQIRTGAPAERVSPEQFTGFHEHLAAAEQVLIDAAARNPYDSAVGVQRLLTARGLRLGPGEVRRRYARLARIDAHNVTGQLQMLQSLCPKWSGTWPEVHAFARDRTLAAPPGAPNALLVAVGHLEHFAELGGGDTARAYLRSDAVRRELIDAADRSVWHGSFGREPGWVLALNAFAMVFLQLGDETAATGLLAAAAPFATRFPWSCLGDPAGVLRAYRRSLAGAAR